MTVKQRLILIGIVCALLLAGFAFGRVTDTPSNTSAEENKAVTAPASNSPSPLQASRGLNGPFYLQDFRSGYDDGFNAATTGEAPAVVATDVTGYNDGFKQGYADAYKSQVNANSREAKAVYRGGQQIVYRSAAPVKRRGSSKLKTALTIAAPAAIGAGIGALAGGGKGAAVGALLGGGGGAAYHLYKNRHR